MSNSYLNDFVDEELSALIEDWKIDRLHELSGSIYEDEIDIPEAEELLHN